LGVSTLITFTFIVFRRTFDPRFAMISVVPPDVHLPTNVGPCVLHCGGPVSVDVVEVEVTGVDAAADDVVEAVLTVTVFVPPPQPVNSALASATQTSQHLDIPGLLPAD
jgi:hypothetical protein